MIHESQGRWAILLAPGKASCLARTMPAVLAFFLAGCAAGDFFRHFASEDPANHAAAPESSAAAVLPGPAFSAPTTGSPSESSTQAAESSSKPNPPPSGPHTLPQAVRAYLHCLCYGPPASEKQSIRQSAEQEQSKNPPAEGAPSTNGNDKEKGTDNREPDQEQAKNPSGVQESGEKEKGQEADKEKEQEKEKQEEQWYSAHAQATVVTQAHDPFRSPYIGPNSLVPHEPSATSMTGTLFLAARLWECDGSPGEVVFNPEIAGGTGFSGATGIADFPNGEITRVGVPTPTPYIARLFLRQTFGFGGEQEKVEDGANEIAGKRDIDRVTFTLGKFAAVDLVDDNSYSHDPRTQFLPWSIMYNGAWDYPANVRGYTYGIGIDYNRKDWALRYGIFQEPEFANSAPLDSRIVKAHGQVVEWEGRYNLYEHPGKLRLLAYLNRAHMGKYSEALAEMPVNPNVAATRAYRIKYGFGLNWEQEVTKDLGLFARLGWNDGQTESWAFTALDRLAEIGALLKGRCWCRPNDQVGLAFAAAGLAKIHHEYLAAGGLDFIIGDGALDYAPEQVLEIFYNVGVIKGMNVTVDFQEVVNPAYNRDRGPVSIGSLRVHFEF